MHNIQVLVSLSQDKVAINTAEDSCYYYYHTYRPKRLTIAMPILVIFYFAFFVFWVSLSQDKVAIQTITITFTDQNG